MLGYPDQAVIVSDAKDEHGRRRGHPFDLGFALTTGAHVFDYRNESEALLQRAEEAARIGRENSMPFVSEILASMQQGVSRLRAGKIDEAIQRLSQTIALWDGSQANIWSPYLKALLGEALALSGDVEGGLRHIDTMLAQIERPGWKERSHYAEVLRLKGWMLELRGQRDDAESHYRKAIEFAREQKSRSWELRSTTSLARLLFARSDAIQARTLLTPIYEWFSEGRDTHDLKAARDLLARPN